MCSGYMNSAYCKLSNCKIRFCFKFNTFYVCKREDQKHRDFLHFLVLLKMSESIQNDKIFWRDLLEYCTGILSFSVESLSGDRKIPTLNELF